MLNLAHQSHSIEIIESSNGYQANVKTQDNAIVTIAHPGFSAADTLKAAIYYLDANAAAESAAAHLAKLGLPDNDLAPIYAAIDTLVAIATRP